jgi:uncharacterized membrane protein YuzA (DUF378 family)
MPAQPRPATPAAIAAALLIPIAVSSALAAAITALVRAVATVPSDFAPFQPFSYIALIVIGVVAGAAGWLAVRRRAANPSHVMRSLAPVVVVLSFIPDVLVGVTKFEAGTTWAGVGGLMAMHLVVALCAVAAFARFLPLAGQPQRREAGAASVVSGNR